MLKVSIIIRTKNEEQWIDQCLNKIKNQSYNNYEIIIVDNKSTDLTLSKITKFNVKLVKVKKFLPGNALNRGIKKSSGEIIVCLSAHSIPENNNWLLKLVQNFKDKSVAGVYGRQLPLAYSSDFDKRDLYTFFGLEKRVQKKDSFFHNANSAIRKSLWKKIPFDEKVEHIEDRIWAHQIIKKGYKIVYEPEAAVYHWHGINQNMDEKRCSEIVKILENIDNIYKPKTITFLKDLNILAIVPQRNIPLLYNNKDYLITKTINDLKKSKYISDIYVATDNKITKKIVLKHGVKSPFLRSKNLSLDYVDIGSVASYYLKKLEKKKYLPTT
jgi:rhamnosyltransferase